MTVQSAKAPVDYVEKPIPHVFSRSVSWPGLVTGAFFFVFSLLPSLLPRTSVTQGVVSGVTVLFGYGLGVFGQWAWLYLGIPRFGSRAWTVARRVLYVLLIWILLFTMWRYVGFQNNLRDVFGMDRISAAVWLTIVPVAVLVAALLLIIGRALRRLLHLLTRWLDKLLPARVARLLGAVFLGLLLWGLWSGVLVNGFFAAANQMFAPRDAATNDGIVQPQDDNVSGGPSSLVAWDDLGRQGRTFVATATPVSDLNEFHGGGAVEPIRVYVGLKSGETHEERAVLILDELIRTGAFERDVLIVATTTGTGFLEPNAMTALEYVHNGNVAVAGVQYSYLPSWISLLADQDEVKETSQVVFDAIHGYWATLPVDSRPDIYLYGLSLGSFGVESILTSVEFINEPIDGALLVGPPFVNQLSSALVDDRDPGSSPSRAIYEQGRTVRFTNEISAVSLPTGKWEDTRILYLQHASDPVVFFSPKLALNSPDWLLPGQRGVEISDDFEWLPLVTMWQVLIDLPAAGSVTDGFGHLYSKGANADSWIAVTDHENWSTSEIAELRDYLETLPSGD